MPEIITGTIVATELAFTYFTGIPNPMSVSSEFAVLSRAVGAEKIAANGRSEPGCTPLSELQPTNPITMSRSERAKFQSDVFENGVQNPVKYVRGGNTKYIVDGNHRFFAASSSGMTSVPTQEVKLPYSGFDTPKDLFNFGLY